MGYVPPDPDSQMSFVLFGIKTAHSYHLSVLCTNLKRKKLANEARIWCNNVVDNWLLDFLECLTAFSPVTGLSYIIAVLLQHRFQISKKLSVKLYHIFLWTARLRRNLNYFAVNLPLNFSKSSIFPESLCFLLLCEFKKIIEKILKLL